MDIMYSVSYVWQWFQYEVLGRSPGVDLSELPDRINFISHYDDKNDVHWLECPDLPEFYVTGKDKAELAQNVTDTLLVYFDVPTYYARRFKPDNTTFSFENKKTGEHEYVSLEYMEELARSLA